MKKVLAILFLLPLAARRAGVFVERLSVPLAENHSLDDIAEAARVATERRPGAG